MKKNVLRALGLLGLSFMLSYCGNDKSVQPTFSSLQQNIFNDCASSGCHTSTPSQTSAVVKSGLDLSTNMYAQLQSKTINNTMHPHCSGVPVINPNDYSHSMFAAMAGDIDGATFAANNGGCQPELFVNMSENQVNSTIISNVKSWINQGAPNN